MSVMPPIDYLTGAPAKQRGISFSPSPTPVDRQHQSKSSAEAFIVKWQEEATEGDTKSKGPAAKGKEPRTESKQIHQTAQRQPPTQVDKKPPGSPFDDLLASDPALAAMTFGYSRGELAALQELRKLRQQSPQRSADTSELKPIVAADSAVAASKNSLQRVIEAQYLGERLVREGLIQPIPNANAPTPTPLRGSQRPISAAASASYRKQHPPLAATNSTRATTPSQRTLLVSGPNYLLARAKTPPSTRAAGKSTSPAPKQPPGWR
eukprot:GDKJ01015185.1.p1 GENE.GDKJ01015185.1~~GDKJ01015185.1.p1  ORF type:complete len:265 (-),score=15.55 GDKJ01015185.1:38-832(-)